MWAEKDSNTNLEQYLNLPPELIAKATHLGGELAWMANDALQAIQWLAASGYAVVGVELWQNCGGKPMWIATSDYAFDENGDRQRYTTLCAQGATEFVQRFLLEPEALFNLSY